MKVILKAFGKLESNVLDVEGNQEVIYLGFSKLIATKGWAMGMPGKLKDALQDCEMKKARFEFMGETKELSNLDTYARIYEFVGLD